MKNTSCVTVLALIVVAMMCFDAHAWRRKSRDDDDDRAEGLKVKVEYIATYLDTLNEGKEIALTGDEFQKIVASQQSPKALEQNQAGQQDGFRIQCFASSNIEAVREEKRAARSSIDLKSYIVFVDPYYKLYVGDFDTREKADRALNKVKHAGYPQAWIVRSKINP